MGDRRRIVPAFFHRDDGHSHHRKGEIKNWSTRRNERYPHCWQNQSEGIHLPSSSMVVVYVIEPRAVLGLRRYMCGEEMGVNQPVMVRTIFMPGVDMLERGHHERHQ